MGGSSYSSDSFDLPVLTHAPSTEDKSSVYAPKNIRPRPGWCVVLADQRKEKLASGIFLPGNETGVEKVTEGAGTIIRVGNGEKNFKLGLEAGQRIVYRGFLKHANPIETEEKWEDGSTKQYFIMSSDDIIGIMAPGVEVGIYSGRPMNPERTK